MTFLVLSLQSDKVTSIVVTTLHAECIDSARAIVRKILKLGTKVVRP
jgi:hypothetical protein